MGEGEKFLELDGKFRVFRGDHCASDEVAGDFLGMVGSCEDANGVAGEYLAQNLAHAHAGVVFDALGTGKQGCRFGQPEGGKFSGLGANACGGHGEDDQREGKRFAVIAERHDLYKVLPAMEFRPEYTVERLFKRCETLIDGIGQKTVLDQLQVVAESHRLREQRPEDILRIRLKIGEDGMEWQTIEKSDGTLERRLLPE